MRKGVDFLWFLSLVRSAAHRPLRFRKLRSTTESWDALLAASGSISYAPALAFEESNIRTASLWPLLRGNTSLRLLSIHKCHSIDGDALVNVLPPTLEALNFSGLNLGDCMGQEGNLCRLHGLRVLSLPEYQINFASLVELLPCLP